MTRKEMTDNGLTMGRMMAMVVTILLLTACSTTKNIPDDDQLFVGLTKIDYRNYERNQNFIDTQEEIEAALATAPNGALFGSSYYRTPFPYGLWIWNAFSGKENGFARWMTESFGKKPVLMSWVNPALRASVAQSVLRKYGYFRGTVDYDTVPQRNPKKSKIGYTVNMDHLFTIDSIAYLNFPEGTDSLIQATRDEAMIAKGEAFTVPALDAERTRLTNLFRNNGYYYFQNSYASYLADTLAVPGKVQLRLQAADGLPDEALRKWYIGNVTIDLRRQFMQEVTDSMGRRHFKVRFHGRRPPLRLSVIMNNMKLRHGQPYSYDDYLESMAKVNSTGIFGMVDFTFTPRPTSQLSDSTSLRSPLTSPQDTLDLTLNCVLDKPYDSYIETNLKNKTSGRIGPELVLGFTKRNAFRGGELLDINLHGSYEWQRAQGTKGSKRLNSYEYGIDASLEFPRIVLPWREWARRRAARRMQRAANDSTMQRPRANRRLRERYYSTPSTIAKLSRNTLNRPSYFKMVNFSGEWTYRWQKTQNSRHEMSPLTITYQHLVHTTLDFDSIVLNNAYLVATMRDVFIPKMRYTYTYTSPSSYRNPITWETTVSEAGNVSSLVYMAFGKKWNEEDKEMFKNPYSQFVKVETDFTKHWRLSNTSQLVAHLNAGVIYSFGNSNVSPFSETFYVGGANSIRAFTVRSIGPGGFRPIEEPGFSYLLQNGDVRLLGNLEYRTRLFGRLHGAAFLDAGNVWDLRDYFDIDGVADLKTQFKLNRFYRQMALGTGVGLRYDLDFLVIRLDWGIGLHVPYDTGKGGFYNIPRFRDGQALHLAVGYPF